MIAWLAVALVVSVAVNLILAGLFLRVAWRLSEANAGWDEALGMCEESQRLTAAAHAVARQALNERDAAVTPAGIGSLSMQIDSNTPRVVVASGADSVPSFQRTRFNAGSALPAGPACTVPRGTEPNG